MMNLMTFAQGETPESAVAVSSVWDFVVKGGVMMIPIGVCSLIVLAVTIERLITLSRRRIIPPKFLDSLRPHLERHDLDAALATCKKSSTPIARIMASGIRQFGRPVELVEKHMTSAGEAEIFTLRKYVRVLSVIAAVAPLMGLTGTIFGMIKAFQTVALSADALGKAERLAGGIYEAMITTAAGLIVAIPTLIFYHWIAAKIERLVREMDRMCVDFVEEFAYTHGRADADGVGDPDNGRAAPAPQETAVS